MSDVIAAIGALDDKRRELGKRSDELADVNRKLEPVKRDHDEFVSNYKAGLWDKLINGEINKLPAEDIRDALALREMPTDLRGPYLQLTESRDRLRKRISDLRLEVEALRSVLSAEKDLARD